MEVEIVHVKDPVMYSWVYLKQTSMCSNICLYPVGRPSIFITYVIK